MLILAVTTAIAGIFFGGALYVALVEHPARIECGAAIAVKEFAAAYRRAAILMGGLSTVGCVLGLVAAWRLQDWHVAIYAIFLGVPVPLTLLLLAPVNKALFDPALDTSGPRAVELLLRWDRLHWVRTLFGGLAFLLMLFRLVLHARGAA